MRALVTGGAGFIGSHLCDALLARGDHVTVVDNLVTGSLDNIEHLQGNPSFEFQTCDVTAAPPDGIWDAVLYLASPASPVGYGEHPVETMLANSVGVHNYLELAARCGARFLLTSTSEIYGDPLVHPQPEDYWGNVNPIGPRACYDEGKRFAEALTITYLREFNLDVRIVRIFNTYGPRNRPEDGRIIPNFITQAIRGEPITVFGDGRQTRSYCYVHDLVRGILAVLEHDAARGEVINLGTPVEYSALETAQLVKQITQSPSPVVHLPGRAEEIARRKPDIAKAKRLLGWEPVTSFADGLAPTIAWFRTYLARGARAGIRGV